MRVRTIALAIAPVLTGGVVFTPVAQAADGATPDPEDTTSVPVTDVPKAAGAAPEAEDKTVPLPEPTWPSGGQDRRSRSRRRVPRRPPTSASDPKTPSRHPNRWPWNRSASCPIGNTYGPGVAYTIEPAIPEPETPETPETPAPTDPVPTTPEPTATTPPAGRRAAGVLYRSSLFETPPARTDTDPRARGDAAEDEDPRPNTGRGLHRADRGTDRLRGLRRGVWRQLGESPDSCPAQRLHHCRRGPFMRDDLAFGVPQRHRVTHRHRHGPRRDVLCGRDDDGSYRGPCQRQRRLRGFAVGEELRMGFWRQLR